MCLGREERGFGRSRVCEDSCLVRLSDSLVSASLQIFSELKRLKSLKLETSYAVMRELNQNMKSSGCC
jgi:hypothetical protein